MNKVTLDYGGALDYGVPAGTYYADPAGEIAALTAKLEAAEKDVVRITAERDKAWTDGCNLLDTVTEQAAQIEALEKDAARYRWLADYLVSDRTEYDDALVACADKSDMDAVIDAAMLGDSHA